MSPLEQLFLDSLPVVDSAVRRVALRHHLSADERDELSSLVRVHIIQDDYGVLRRFEGRSELRTYLTTVVTHVMLDERTRQRGKWRPTRHAQRLGPLAETLERLRDRDGHTAEEAAAIVANRSAGALSIEDARAMCDRLPPRLPRQFDAEVELEQLPSTAPDQFASVVSREAAMVRERAFDLLRRALEALPPGDALILRMQLERGLKIADIARALHRPQKPLYRRLEALRDHLRTSLEAGGITAAQVREFLSTPEPEPESDEAEPHSPTPPARETGTSGPSTSRTGESERASDGRAGETP